MNVVFDDQIGYYHRNATLPITSVTHESEAVGPSVKSETPLSQDDDEVSDVEEQILQKTPTCIRTTLQTISLGESLTEESHARNRLTSRKWSN